jgi:RHS repeat-associated protein
MTTYRRILKALWRTGVFSVALVVLVLATSVMVNLPPPVFAATGGGEASSENVTEALPRDPEPPRPKITARAKANQDTDVESESKKIKLHIPKGAVSQEAEIEIVEHGPLGTEGNGMLNVLELNAFHVHWGTVITSNKVRQFNQELTISIKHEAEELRGLDIDTLKLCYLDEASGEWVPVLSSRFDPETNTLTATIDHFSYYGENANPTILGPGKVMASLNGLHSGAAVTDYAFEVPQGSGGFQPSIGLFYNSASVDEMKNKRSVGSWVGIGWSLGLGSVSYDAGTGQYLLSLDGATYYKLVQDAGGVYHTSPESFFKITRTGQQWDVYDREGRYYRFGGTADSQQYCDGSVYYRWDLSYVRDVNMANAITVTYVQDTWTDTLGKTHVRSAYPSHVQYNNGHVDIQFNSSYDTNEPGYGPLRRDNPQSPIPKVVENRKLDSIEIKVDGSLAKKYVFAYNTTDDYYSSDYGGMYYAGRHKLTSITEYGSDGISALPITNFTYTDLQIYHKDDDQATYIGNPGNPASLTWPYLATVTSGYGATTSYSYTQKPLTTVKHVWTREVVNTKTTNPGIGPLESYQYTYTGDPQYFKVGPSSHGWNDQFRGFSSVKETDAQGNYTSHYFHTAGSGYAETLSGREYALYRYNAAGSLLETTQYDWAYQYADATPPSLPSGLVGYWKLDENTGQYIYDSSGNGNTGTRGSSSSTESYDPAWTSYGRYGPALDFDGSNDYADLGDGSTLNLTGDFTLAAWVKRDTLNNTVCVLASGTGSTNPYYHQFLLEIEPGYYYDSARGCSRVVFSMGKSTKNGYYHQHIGAWDEFPEDSGWHHVAVTFSGTTSSLYVDGVAGTSVTGTSGSRLTSSVLDRRIGSRAGGLNRFDGTIDDVRIYNRALSASEMQQLWRQSVPIVYLKQVTDTMGSKTSRTRYDCDAYGNVTKEYLDGDTSISTDDVIIERDFYPNTSANILGCVAAERVKDQGGTLKKETLFYYDGSNTSVTTPPTKGNLTRMEQKKGDGGSVSTYSTYDSWGNGLTDTDANGNVWTTVYESTYNTFPQSITSPIAGQSENCTFDAKTGNRVSVTDINDQTTTYEYDTFGRSTKVIEPGDSSSSPTVRYEYNNWGTLGQQHLKTLSKVTGGDYLWSSEYFDGLGRAIQTQARGETGRTILESTIAYDSCSQVQRQYVTQDLGSVSGYTAPQADWKYASCQYDGLGRVTRTTAADGTVTSTDYSTAWQETVTNPKGYKHRYSYDGFGQLTKVEELDASHAVYATTTYAYDTLGNLTQITDANGNIITTSYDWLSRKTSMTHPDMGHWSYGYDSNGNLTRQTDAKDATITFTYDALNRLTGKNYPSGSGMTDVTYTYDSMLGGNYGKGLLTGMSDASGTTTYKYDVRGRLIEEKRTVDSVAYATHYSYDSADRLATITYPTGEVVTQTYNGRGLPHTLSGSAVGSLVTQALYNQLGGISRIDIGNGTSTTYAYYGLDAGAPSGYYGRPWQIKTSKSSTVLQDMRYTWDANVNLTQRQDIVSGETEDFTYDFLDRLTSVSGPYTESYEYDKIGNITSRNGTAYTYGNQPHAVTGVGDTNYTYDANGNMMTTSSGSQYVSDPEGRPVEINIPVSNWEKNYGQPYYTYGSSGQQTSDGGFVVAGYTRAGTYPNYHEDYWLMKTDSNGAQQWDRTFSTAGSKNDRGQSVQQTSDGGYIIVGLTYTSTYGDADVWLVKTSSSGEKQWDKTFGGIGRDVPCSVRQTSDGGYIIVGSTSSYGAGGRDIWLIKTDSSGNLQWDKTYEKYGEEEGNCVQQTSDGGYIIVGYTYSATYYHSDAWLIKTNSSGNLQWDKTYGGVAGWNEDFGSVEQTSDGGYVAGGSSFLYTQTEGYGLLVKTDSDGSDQWGKMFNGGSQGCIINSVRQTPDGGYVAVGNVDNGDRLQGYILKLDYAGNNKWCKVGFAYGYQPKAVGLTSDGGYLVVGECGYDVYANKPWMAKVNVSESTFAYDGDGDNILKTEGGETTVRVNKYYEKNLTTGEETSRYYLGDREIAYKKSDTLEYVHQDHLGSTVMTTDDSGSAVATIAYLPFGGTRSTTGEMGTDKLFTGQRLVDNGLYNYNARYYDSNIGRFISPDSVVQDLGDPQSLNPYAYCRNNPLKYTDPSGHFFWVPLLVGFFVGALVGAAGYTASVVIDNAIHHQPLLDNWDPVDCATWAAVGGVSGAILSGGALVTAMGSRFAASMLVNTVGSEVGYGISAGRKGEWTPEGALLAGGIAAGFTAVGFGLSKLAPVDAPNKGALGPWWNKTLTKGDMIDRYGPLKGRYAAPTWVPKFMRSLSPASRELERHTLEVTRDLNVKMSITMPYYWQLGLGPQYRFSVPITDLIGDGLRIVK